MNVANPSDNNCELKVLEQLLFSGKYEEAKSIIQSDAFISQPSNTISILVDYINRNTFEKDQKLFECCESLLYQVAELAQPDDCLIDFIEQAEKHDEFVFPILLRALQISLLKITDNRGRATAWCLNTIIGYINSMPQTDDLILEGEECIILENDDSSQKIINVYKASVDFSEVLIAVFLDEDIKRTEDEEGINNLIVFLVKLLGRPLANYDLQFHNIKGEFRLLAERIVENIKKFNFDLTHLLHFVSSYNPNKKLTATDIVDKDFNNLSLGVFYYLIFREEVGLDNISHVYHPLFLLEKISTLALSLFQVEHSKIQNKGLLLLECILHRVSDFSLDFNTMNCEIFGSLSESLARIMVYSSVKENRILSVPLFQKLLLKFNSHGRYYILYNIQSKVTNPGFIGYIITITKEFVNKTLNDRNPMDLEYFTGKHLCLILKKYCTLSAESDLIELYDQIISSLNFIIFLLLKDKENMSGFLEFLSEFEKDYLEPLKTGLTLSTAHYELQKTELNNAVANDKLEVTVGDIQLPALPNEHKVGVIETVLMNFDLIRSLVGRLEECLRSYKLSNIVYKKT